MLKKITKKLLRRLPQREIASLIRKFGIPPIKVQGLLNFENEHFIKVDEYCGFKAFGLPSLFWHGLYGGKDSQLIKVWLNLSKQSQRIIDVGANVGLYSLIAAAVNQSACIFAFEPIERNYNMLVGNKIINNFTNISCIKSLVGEHDGTESVFFNQHRGATASMRPRSGANEEVVPITTLSTFVEDLNINPVELIKIDVEGFEPVVLRGMSTILQQTTPTFIVEVLDDNVGQEIQSQLQGKGYEFYLIDEEVGPIKCEEIRRKSKFSRDYLLCTSEVARTLNLCP